MSRLLRVFPFVLVLHFLVLPQAPGGFAAAERAIGPSGLPVPRYVSLRSAKVNLRAGPGLDHEVLWTYVRRGLPVEIIEEYENWRRIRDAEGTQGWVNKSLLDGKRFVVVLGSEEIILLAKPAAKARPVARLEPGVLARLRGCDGGWCRISAGGYTGWLTRPGLWGVYSNEPVE